MNDFTNYADIANLTWDALPEGKLLPIGSWRLKGKAMKLMEAKEEGKNPFILYIYKATEPMDDVDEASLAELGEDYDYGLKPVFVRQFIEDASSWKQVKDRLALHNVVPQEGESIPDTMKRFRGSEVIAYLDQREYTNNAGILVQENVASNFTNPEGE